MLIADSWGSLYIMPPSRIPKLWVLFWWVTKPSLSIHPAVLQDVLFSSPPAVCTFTPLCWSCWLSDLLESGSDSGSTWIFLAWNRSLWVWMLSGGRCDNWWDLLLTDGFVREGGRDEEKESEEKKRALVSFAFYSTSQFLPSNCSVWNRAVCKIPLNWHTYTCQKCAFKSVWANTSMWRRSKITYFWKSFKKISFLNLLLVWFCECVLHSDGNSEGSCPLW